MISCHHLKRNFLLWLCRNVKHAWDIILDHAYSRSTKKKGRVVMILNFFILGNNLVSLLCMKIIHSVVVVELYYGFLATYSIRPSYFFLLQAWVMKEIQEGTEKNVSTTTDFNPRHMVFISTYYVSMHLAFGRPHTISVPRLYALLGYQCCRICTNTELYLPSILHQRFHRDNYPFDVNINTVKENDCSIILLI